MAGRRTTESGFGALLRDARKARGVSQLTLALDADVSARHLSFLETGRAEPSREMVLRLAEALDLPLRERNLWLTGAGFASIYTETSLDAPEMATLRRVLFGMIDRYDPYPALLIDRGWNVVHANAALGRTFARFVGTDPVWTAQPLNLVHLTLHPGGLRPWLVNWDDVAAYTLLRLSREAALASESDELAALLEAARGYPDLPPARPTVPEGPVLPLHLKRDDLELRLFSTVTTVGSPGDITLEDLRIEAFVPADDASEAALHALAE
ncbi:MAG: helix-turn-helix transcriptional regulator [Myxococcota bacterium]